MRIGLIFPNKDRKDKTVHLGLGYLASYSRIKHPDILFSLLDTRVASLKESKDFYNTEFDLIGITVLSPVYSEVINVFNHIKSSKPNTLICLGGPYVTTIMEEIFEETPADFAVYGEGEITFSELLHFVKGNQNIENINGLMYFKNNKIFTNPPRKLIKNLDNLPYPAYDLFKMNRYPMHRIVSSRGCPFKCVFCNSSSIWLGKWRKREPEDIINEIIYLIENYKKKPFSLNDNSFNIDLNRVNEFCSIIIKKKVKFMWTTPVRVEKINIDTARLMKQAGCYNVSIGIESANNSILQQMKKQNTIEDVQNGIKIFRKAGIDVLGQFVIGSIGDTLETVKESIDFAKKINIDFILFYSVLPFKGTKQWDHVVEHGNLLIPKIHMYHTTKPRIVFETPEFSYQDRLKAIELAENEGFYADGDDQSAFFDFCRSIATKIQQFLPYSISRNLYITMKNIYRNILWKN